jgi:hypothetical protein
VRHGRERQGPVEVELPAPAAAAVDVDVAGLVEGADDVEVDAGADVVLGGADVMGGAVVVVVGPAPGPAGRVDRDEVRSLLGVLVECWAAGAVFTSAADDPAR